MGIFSRFNQLIQSNLTAMLDSAEDPDKLLSQHVLDMESELKKAKQELISAMATHKVLLKKQEELLATAKSWEDKAMLALKAGDENLAREALRFKAKTEREAEEASKRAASEDANAASMKTALERAEAKIEDMKARKGTLAAEMRQARSQATSPAADVPRQGGAFDELARMTDKLDQYEAEVEAEKVLGGAKEADVEARFRALEKAGSSDVVEDALASLKRKLEGK